MRLLIGVGLVWAMVACNKNTLELPPPANNLLAKDTICKLNFTDKLRLLFLQDKNDREGKLKVKITNLSGITLPDLILYIEACNGEPDFLSCNQSTTLRLPDFGGAGVEEMELPFRQIQLASARLNFGIVTTRNDASLTLPNTYQANAVFFDSTHIIGKGRAVVFEDGNFVFRILYGTSTTYNISGNFLNDTAAIQAGLMYSKDPGSGSFIPTATVNLMSADTVPVFNNFYFSNSDNLVRCILKTNPPFRLPPPADTAIGKIAFILKKER
jgi:hypothetical protein